MSEESDKEIKPIAARIRKVMYGGNPRNLALLDKDGNPIDIGMVVNFTYRASAERPPVLELVLASTSEDFIELEAEPWVTDVVEYHLKDDYTKHAEIMALRQQLRGVQQERHLTSDHEVHIELLKKELEIRQTLLEKESAKWPKKK